MFEISYENWIEVCDMYFRGRTRHFKSFIQLFPFSQTEEIEKIRSEEFYNKYIKNGTGILFPEFLFRTENFIQKGDGSFRNAHLVSPFTFLILQSIGLLISSNYNPTRPDKFAVYYAGNYPEKRPHYKKDYDEFYKNIKNCIEYEEYNYFIKTDIHDFYNNIDLNQLFNKIDVNEKKKTISPNRLHVYNKFISYCGNGKFPLIEGSIASSYLATIIYLDEIDTKLFEFVATVFGKNSFKMIRYVDDLYILIRSEKSIEQLSLDYEEIIHKYSTFLKKEGLSINMSKTSLDDSKHIYNYLKKSLYDDEYENEDDEIEQYASVCMNTFLDSIYNASSLSTNSIKEYMKIIEDAFSIDGVICTPHDVYNYCIYEDSTILEDKKIHEILNKILKENIEFIKLDSKRLTILILNSKNENAIKKLINNLFKRNGDDSWNAYDVTIAITYLIQRNFKHEDLLNIIKTRCSEIHNYYSLFCKNPFTKILDNKNIKSLCSKAIEWDEYAAYLYFMYLFEKNNKNSFEAFSYYKTYFDRITANLDYKINSPRHLNYRRFYTEQQLKTFYRDIDGSVEILRGAHQLRNDSPLSHSNSDLFYNKKSTQELYDSITKLDELIINYCKKNNIY